MSRNVPREWHSCKYLDSRKILVGFREIEQTYPLEQLRPEASSLRTHELREYGEGRQAALFCYAMGQALGTPVSFALVERQDYDIIARFVKDDQLNFVPVQLKEWVPEEVNSKATLQQGVDKLRKYVDSEDLVVAFHLNRRATISLSELNFKNQTVKEIWFYGAADSTQEKWWLIGNLLSDRATSYEFDYPLA